MLHFFVFPKYYSNLCRALNIIVYNSLVLMFFKT